MIPTIPLIALGMILILVGQQDSEVREGVRLTMGVMVFCSLMMIWAINWSRKP